MSTVSCLTLLALLKIKKVLQPNNFDLGRKWEFLLYQYILKSAELNLFFKQNQNIFQVFKLIFQNKMVETVPKKYWKFLV